MHTHFPRTLEAAKQAEKSSWKIGDALLRETEEGVGGKRGLQACADELEANGVEYSPSSLSKLRSAARMFPPARRREEVSFLAHYEAGNPDTLDVIIKAARKTKTRVTGAFVAAAVQESRQEAYQQRVMARQVAEAEEEREAERERLARIRERHAPTSQERELAARDRELAIERRRAASDKVQATKVAQIAPRELTPPPREDEIEPRVRHMNAMSNALTSQKLARDTTRLLGDSVADLSPVAVAALTEAALEAMNLWRGVADLARSSTTSKRGHLIAVNE